MLLQQLFDNVWRRKRDGTVKQSYPDIPQVLDDQKEVFKAARFIGMDNYGIGDCFIVNKDPENYSIT